MKNCKYHISPSLICMDLCNLEQSVREMEALGVEMLHVDLLDGYFSPSLPVGLDTIRQLRKLTSLPFDAHVMVEKYDYFLEALLDIGMQRIAIHAENCRHPDHYLSMIRDKGVLSGLAISPGTPLTILDYLNDRCDYILHMMINPGFASSPSAKIVPYGCRKLRDLRNQIGPDKDITVDGHVGFSNLRELADAGATTFVAGTNSVFHKGNTHAHNLTQMRQILYGKGEWSD